LLCMDRMAGADSTPIQDFPKDSILACVRPLVHLRAAFAQPSRTLCIYRLIHI
jgi:hypothetical protein